MNKMNPKVDFFFNRAKKWQEEFEKLRYQKEGLGLKNIQNRIILLKGSIHFTKGSEGYRVNIEVPAKPITHEQDHHSHS